MCTGGGRPWLRSGGLGFWRNLYGLGRCGTKRGDESVVGGRLPQLTKHIRRSKTRDDAERRTHFLLPRSSTHTRDR